MEQAIGKLFTLQDILASRLFEVPDYQRGYSWEQPQWEDLIHDIEHVCDKDYMHYTGTIVLTKNDNSDRYDIVDGQQRLTTLVILLSELYRSDKEHFSTIKELFMERNEGDVLVLNGENSNFFHTEIINGDSSMGCDTRSKQNIADARKFFKTFIGDNSNRIQDLYQTIIEKLGFLCFVANSSKDVGCMFEVINNRGKGLSELEKIKNYFIYLATIFERKGLYNDINSRWGEILRNLNKAGFVSNENENEFLRNCYLVFYDTNKSRSWHVYEELKTRYPTNDNQKEENTDKKVEEIKEFISFLLSASRHIAWLYSDEPLSEYIGLRKWLDRLRCHHVNASVFPLYLAIMNLFQNEKENLLAMLELIEKFNFRIYVLPNANISRTDSMQGTVFCWAYDLYHHMRTLDDITIEMHEFLNHYGSLEVILRSLTIDSNETIDYYTWGGLRFLLASYEEHLHDERKESWDLKKILRKRKDSDNSNDYLSLEHIWARANREKDFGNSCTDKRRLGNFVLMGMSDNIINQDMDIKEKIDEMQKNKADTSLLQINELKEFYTEAAGTIGKNWQRKSKNYYKGISQFINDRRESKIIEFALERWRLKNEPGIKFKIDSFNAKEGKYYTITPNEIK